MVSTDDAEISEIAIKCGVKVPFLRSEKNADDFATTANVLVEVINQYKKQKKQFDYLCCLYPTAPFVTTDHLITSFDKLKKNKNLDVVFPIVPFSFPVQRALSIKEEFAEFFYPEHTLTRSQDLEPAYHDAGQFYWLRVAPFMKNKTIHSKKMHGIIISERQAQDIDNEDDWMLAEMKYKLLRNKVA